eukprot:1018291-Amphidinium_carterae.1
MAGVHGVRNSCRLLPPMLCAALGKVRAGRNWLERRHHTTHCTRDTLSTACPECACVRVRVRGRTNVELVLFAR